MIVAAAILIDGTVYGLPAPARHHNIIHHLAGRGFPTPILGEQGFIDDGVGFVTRKQAARIAIEQHQIKELMSPPNLFSEDLW